MKKRARRGRLNHCGPVEKQRILFHSRLLGGKSVKRVCCLRSQSRGAWARTSDGTAELNVFWLRATLSARLDAKSVLPELRQHYLEK